MSKKVLVFSNKNPESQEISRKLIKLLSNANMEVGIDIENPNFIVTVGGDGTLLTAFHKYRKYLNTTRFIGIHTGHLGFYADWQSYELPELVDAICKSNGESTSYPLIEIKADLLDGNQLNELALNEFAIRALNGTMVSEVFIRDHFFETFRGDGLCIATPTGSTGLSKSLGGAVIHPRLDAIQLTEIASINNRVFRSLGSPIIIPKDEWFELRPRIHSNEKRMLIGIDNMSFENLQINTAEIRIAKERIHFASFRHTHFWNRVENSFIGIQQSKNESKSPNNYLK